MKNLTIIFAVSTLLLISVLYYGLPVKENKGEKFQLETIKHKIHANEVIYSSIINDSDSTEEDIFIAQIKYDTESNGLNFEYSQRKKNLGLFQMHYTSFKLLSALSLVLISMGSLIFMAGNAMQEKMHKERI